MPDKRKITVLLDQEEFDEFDKFCRHNAFKKSTLMVRLLKEFLERAATERNAPMPLFDIVTQQKGNLEGK